MTDWFWSNISLQFKTQACCEQLGTGSRTHFNWPRNLLLLAGIEPGTHHITALFTSHSLWPAFVLTTPSSLGHDFKSEWRIVWDGDNMSCNDLREGRGVFLALGIMLFNVFRLKLKNGHDVNDWWVYLMSEWFHSGSGHQQPWYHSNLPGISRVPHDKAYWENVPNRNCDGQKISRLTCDHLFEFHLYKTQ